MSINGPSDPPHEQGSNPYASPTPQPWSGPSQQHPVVPGNGGQFGRQHGHPGPYGGPYSNPGPYGGPYGNPGFQAPHGVVAAKTSGIAVLLSFLLLGAGHLYAGRVGTGVAFMLTHFFLVLFLFIPFIGWLLAPMIWAGLFVVAAVTASGAVKAHNARWGITGL